MKQLMVMLLVNSNPPQTLPLEREREREESAREMRV